MAPEMLSMLGVFSRGVGSLPKRNMSAVLCIELPLFNLGLLFSSTALSRCLNFVHWNTNSPAMLPLNGYNSMMVVSSLQDPQLPSPLAQKKTTQQQTGTGKQIPLAQLNVNFWGWQNKGRHLNFFCGRMHQPEKVFHGEKWVGNWHSVISHNKVLSGSGCRNTKTPNFIGGLVQLWPLCPAFFLDDLDWQRNNCMDNLKGMLSALFRLMMVRN